MSEADPTGGDGRPRDLTALLERARGLGLERTLDLDPAAGLGDRAPVPPAGAQPAPARTPPEPDWSLEFALDPRAVAPRHKRPPRMILLWLLSSPLLLGALIALGAGRFEGFVGDALGFALIAASALLTRQGFADQSAGRERRFSLYRRRRWRLPLRNVAGVLLGLGTGVTAVLGVGYGLAIGVAFGAVALLGYHLAYGLEPMLTGPSLPAPDRETRAVVAALAEAEGRLLNIERAAEAIGNPELRLRLRRIAQQGRGMLEQIAARPSDLRRARRFLTVFLEGAEQVSDGYVRTHRVADAPEPEPELEERFRNVLVTIEEQFVRQRAQLREADVLDLDVQIEVLKKQLEQEGIR